MRTPSWSTLSAYVDGELDADAAVAVADAAGGDDGSTAQKIALLYQLKGVSHAAAPTPSNDLGDLLPKRRPRWRATIAAAAVALLLVGSATWVSLSAMRAPTLPSDILSTARMLHSQWLSLDEEKASAAEPVVLLAALSEFGQAPVVPDLESTELAISLVTVADGPKGRVLQVGYRGHHGCHLSLFVFANNELPKATVEVENGLDDAYGWRVDSLGYLLFAKGMDQTRLALIADKVEEATRARAPLDGQARQQLAENKRHSASCHA